MKIFKTLSGLLLTLFSVSSAIASTGDRTVVQAGTLVGLMRGVYQGSTSFQELLKYGNFGLGTSDGVRGELVIDQGKVYLSEIDGHSVQLSPTAKTPFAMIVRFHPDQVHILKNISDVQHFEQAIDQFLPSKNLFYAIRVTGSFNLLARTVAPVEGRVPLALWIQDHQRLFHLNHLAGTLVIFRSPDYASPMTVPGYHIHFISADKKQVFHVYNLNFSEAKVEIQTLDHYTVLLPTSAEALTANLEPVSPGDITQMEKRTQ